MRKELSWILLAVSLSFFGCSSKKDVGYEEGRTRPHYSDEQTTGSQKLDLFDKDYFDKNYRGAYADLIGK